MANLFDLVGRGHVVSMDIERLHSLDHPRVDFLIGSDIAAGTVDRVREVVARVDPKSTLVLLDSNHEGPHVLKQLEIYAAFVPVGNYIYVQDGCIDELRRLRSGRPGPLWALRQFVASHPEFVIDTERSSRYLYSHSPSGWLKRVR
jgi:cephalosporin hydroxylase